MLDFCESRRKNMEKIENFYAWKRQNLGVWWDSFQSTAIYMERMKVPR